MIRKLATVLALGASMAVMTACSGPDQSAHDQWANQQTNTDAPPAPISTPLVFGQTHVWPNGDSVMISVARKSVDQKYGPNIINGVPDGHVTSMIVATITYHNGTASPEGLLSGPNAVVLSAMENDQALTSINLPGTDDGNGYTAPGQTRTFVMAWAATSHNPQQIQIQVSGAMFDVSRPVVFFEGTV
jgi:hypothetical protein